MVSAATALIVMLSAITLVIWGIVRLVVKAPKQYGFTSFTNKGEKVRSYGEKQISDFFAVNNIQYQYEPKIKNVFALPDFYLPEYDVYVEYWGLVNADDPKVKNSYVRHMKKKMARYHSNKIKFISIYPDNLKNLDWIFRKKFEDATGNKFPN